MPVVNIFQTLRERIEDSPAFKPMEKRALYWFQTFQTQISQWQRSIGNRVTYARLNEQPISKRIVPASQLQQGMLYFFLYEPTNAKTLPYYDHFPFVLVIDKAQESFAGLNFHYLNYYWRAVLFDRLYEQRRKSPDPLKVQMKFTYESLTHTTKYKQFRPCYKRYLYKNMRSPLFQVGESEWDVALWLPVELWHKQISAQIWKDSEKQFK